VIIAKLCKYDPAQDKVLTHYMNVNVLLGPKANIDVAKPLVDAFINELGGTWEKIDRAQAI